MLPTATLRGAAEFGSHPIPRLQISHVLFDFDGTLSWLRHGWPGLMVSLFRPHLTLQPGESEQALRNLLLADVLSLNGNPSIYQMRRCADRVAERGGNAPDPEVLLAEYERKLDEAIATRTARITDGRVHPDEFVIHGARVLLEKLSARGLTLIILSGTAEPRVKAEAALLGLAKFFDNHIYGSTADHAGSSKAAVIARLLRDEALSGERLLSFGDGPVELRLTREAGGLAVGVASDEEHNGSGEMDQAKREQLLAAGAHLLIPDYRESDALLECLMGN